jgi:hypothetical protein
MLFIALFFVGYFYVLERPRYAPTIVPSTLLDRMIGFEPLALPLYLSLWVYVSLLSALLETRRELCGYGIAMAATCMTGLLIFYFWPTAVPAANIDWSAYPKMSFLKSVDATGNACPSLHVATAVFSGAWLHYLLRRCGAPPGCSSSIRCGAQASSIPPWPRSSMWRWMLRAVSCSGYRLLMCQSDGNLRTVPLATRSWKESKYQVNGAVKLSL